MNKDEVAKYLSDLKFPTETTSTGIVVYADCSYWKTKRKIRYLLQAARYKGRWRWEEPHGKGRI